ncbi:hypothetical protein CC78DRAFT_486389 [Lojkania enalia]|uniref:Uncharacterized protein n=1 Tax=Lojkania enalia TaxID=147567 RepID=A0A9P4NAI8_9PLEO|nr:hypothetical protein CC78DRAFT_486389 [Didymosphaeria enalia]
MNTIAPPPQIKKLPPGRRAFGIFLGFVGGVAGNIALGYAGFTFYTRQTKFVPYDTTHPDLQTPVFRTHNPASNPPICIDHAVKTIPLSQLKTQDQRQLTTDFCRGVWSGLGYAYQRRYLERKYRALEGRDKDLWTREELAKSEYQVGTRITDHFEVLLHDDEKVIVRCGDSPSNSDPRPSDGLFAMEVTKDDEAQTATFHLKTCFVNTTPEGKDAQPLPWNFQLAHRLYTKLWMEAATRKLLK